MQPTSGPPGPLANPVRLAIVERLRARAGATLHELAEAAGVHKNTARVHAEALRAAGLIEREPPANRKSVGRPPSRYRLARAARAIDPQPLARLLGAALSESRLSRLQARRLAHALAAGAGVSTRRRAARELERSLSALGFSAEVSAERIELDGCPCPVAAPGNPALVCALASGTVDGTLERVGATERVVAAAHDPAARRCTLWLAKPQGA